MLGEQIGEETGEITGIRVLPGEGAGSRVEVSFQANGILMGAPVTNRGTYVSEARPDGTLFGDGRGVTMTGDGEMATWHGQGVGRFTGHGSGVSFRGAIYFQSTADRLAPLNSVAALFEYESDENGKTVDRTYEWK